MTTISESGAAHERKGPVPHHERVEDPTFRQAVELIDAGDAVGLRSLLAEKPALVQQRVAFEGEGYFQSPTLLEFVAENPVRRGKLPENIVEVTRVILEAGPGRASRNAALTLVASGRVARECGVQEELIRLLCEFGAEPDQAVPPAAAHGELEAVRALVAGGAKVNLPVAAALGDDAAFADRLGSASADERWLALALAAQFGRVAMVRALLDAGEDPSRFNPPGAHAHSTTLHQAALAGHDEVVRLLVDRGAGLALRDKVYEGTPAGWAEHGGKAEIVRYLQARLHHSAADEGF